MSDVSDENNRAYYDDFSAGYETERGFGYHRMLDDLEMQVVAPFAQGKRVLEIGCGTGLILTRLARVATHAVGIDVSPGMLRAARERGLRVALASATRLPFPDESFDLVCSFKVLAHVPDVERALIEITRVTRPNGRMILEFYNPWSLRYLAKRIAGPQAISEGRTEADVFTRWHSPLAIRTLLPANVAIEGFRGVRVLTPAAFVHKLPVLSDVLVRAERRAVDSPLRYFGGFLIVIARKR
ncbi:MAG: class I SAM-dependent methyltransferase [Polyangiales bacterium]